MANTNNLEAKGQQSTRGLPNSHSRPGEAGGAVGLCSRRAFHSAPHPSILSKRSWDGTGNKWPTDQAAMGAVQGGGGLVGKKNILVSDDSCTEEDQPANKENLSLLRVISSFFDMST